MATGYCYDCKYCKVDMFNKAICTESIFNLDKDVNAKNVCKNGKFEKRSSGSDSSNLWGERDKSDSGFNW